VAHGRRLTPELHRPVASRRDGVGCALISSTSSEGSAELDGDPTLALLTDDAATVCSFARARVSLLLPKTLPEPISRALDRTSVSLFVQVIEILVPRVGFEPTAYRLRNGFYAPAQRQHIRMIMRAIAPPTVAGNSK